MEDTLHVGATRPAMFLGLPVFLTVLILLLWYLIWVNVGGWRGGLWGTGLMLPAWVLARLSIANDLYGMAVIYGWLLATLTNLDRAAWGWASSRSPLPTQAVSPRGMRHAG